MMALVDGFPAGLTIDESKINDQLRRRQGGYGRGKRQDLEVDTVEIMSGVWNNLTIGSPIQLQIKNNDHKLPRLKELPRPRPGHGDLSGSIKYLSSIRGILERASARETAARVAAGALTEQLLEVFGVRTMGYVVEVGGVAIPAKDNLSFEEKIAERNASELYTLDRGTDDCLKQLIEDARSAGDTLGGIVEVRVEGLPFGLGTHAQWDRKLDGRLAQAVMAVQAIKGVEIGMGFEAARRRGSEVHDPIQFDASKRNEPSLGYTRPTNHAGGLEAGMTNGQPLIIRAAKKPISTLQKPLESIVMQTKEPSLASYERSDVCAISAASVIVECVVAFEIAAAFVEKFGGDSLAEMQDRYRSYLNLAQQR